MDLIEKLSFRQIVHLVDQTTDFRLEIAAQMFSSSVQKVLR